MAGAWIESTLPNIVSALTTQNANFLSEFSALTTNAARMEYCLADEAVKGWICLIVGQFTSNLDGFKSSKAAAKHREEGNDCFRSKNYEKAIEIYSTAIRFAPQSMDTASEVALAYANRSAAYLQVGEYENALKDIDAALEFGYARFKPVTKLQLRKCDCLSRLRRAREARQFLLFMQQPTTEQNDSDRWAELFDETNFDGINLNDKKNETSKADISLIDKLTQKGLFKSNEKIPSLSTKVAVCYDAEKGRHLVAQEDIQFGDILGISNPYAAILNPQEDTLKCHHCCRDFFLEDKKLITSLRPVPCTNCSSVMFCSEECRDESSNSYHRYECKHYALLAKFSEFYRLPFRILYRAGMEQIRAVVSAEQDKDLSYFSDQPENHYSHVYHLTHISDEQLFDLDIPYMEVLRMSLIACVLFHLVKLGPFPMDTKEDEKLISVLMLRHLFQMRYNLFEHIPSETTRFMPSYLYPVFASTLNHSCKENANLELPSNKYTCILQATRPISTGTEITIPYFNDRIKPHDYDGYRNLSCERKVDDLLRQYHFRCNCAQCKYQIRNMPIGALRYVPLGCSECGHLMERFSEQTSEAEVFRCTKCPLVMNSAEVKRRYNQEEKLQKLSSQLNLQIDFQNFAQQNSLFRLLESTTERLESLVHRDSAFVTGYVRFIISLHYQSIGQWDKWWACIEQYLTVTERIFAKESMQYIKEFKRIQVVQAEAIAKEPMMMENFKQQYSNVYERYLARIEQWKQLKLKYYLDC